MKNKNGFSPLEKIFKFNRRSLFAKSNKVFLSMFRKHNSLTGFTIIELIAAMTIAFILSVTVVSYTRPYSAIRLDSAAKRLASDIRYTHELAVTRRANHGIYFEPSNDKYYIYKQNTTDKITSPITGQDMIVSYVTTGQFKGIDLVSSNFGYKLEFDSVGEPYDGYGSKLVSTGIITLQHSSGLNKTIKIEPETGKVYIQ